MSRTGFCSSKETGGGAGGAAWRPGRAWGRLRGGPKARSTRGERLPDRGQQARGRVLEFGQAREGLSRADQLRVRLRVDGRHATSRRQVHGRGLVPDGRGAATGGGAPAGRQAARRPRRTAGRRVPHVPDHALRDPAREEVPGGLPARRQFAHTSQAGSHVFQRVSRVVLLGDKPFHPSRVGGFE